MPKGYIFWGLMFLWLIFGLYWYWPTGPAAIGVVYLPVGGHVIMFILFALLGWQVFGKAVQ